jgi:transcriptional regulator with XRE-family HTH domain
MFKERFKQLRESKGLTQYQLAEELNLGRASISNYELGTRTPDIDVLVRIANYFNVTTDYLTGISNFKTYKDAVEVEKSTMLFNSLIPNIPKVPNQDIFHQVNQILGFYNELYKYNIKLFLDFSYSIDYLIDIFQSLINFIETQTPMDLVEYKKTIKEKLGPYPKNEISKKKYDILKERIDIDILFSQDLALEKACPELYKILNSH